MTLPGIKLLEINSYFSFISRLGIRRCAACRPGFVILKILRCDVAPDIQLSCFDFGWQVHAVFFSIADLSFHIYLAVISIHCLCR